MKKLEYVLFVLGILMIWYGSFTAITNKLDHIESMVNIEADCIKEQNKLLRRGINLMGGGQEEHGQEKPAKDAR